MTSEGQHAGQPAEATSGGGAETSGADGFPPDADGQRFSSRTPPPPYPPVRSPQDPNSYGPPPQATPNGGSPFVVPAVPPFGQAQSAPLPQRGAPDAPDPSAWAPQPGRDDDAHPYRPATGDFHGFAPGSPTRGSAGQEQTGDHAGRPPGISAFGDQRKRVPGATLTGLPDAPAEDPDGAPAYGGPIPGRAPLQAGGAFGAARPAGPDSPRPPFGGPPADGQPFGTDLSSRRPFGGDLPSRRPGEQSAPASFGGPSGDNSGQLPGRPPAADQASAPLPSRQPFGPPANAAGSGPATHGDPAEGRSSVTGGSGPGARTYGEPSSGAHPFGPPADQFGDARPGSGEPRSGATVFGQPAAGNSGPSGRPGGDGQSPFGHRGNTDGSPFGSGTASSGGTANAGGPISGAPASGADPFGRSASSAFGDRPGDGSPASGGPFGTRGSDGQSFGAVPAGRPGSGAPNSGQPFGAWPPSQAASDPADSRPAVYGRPDDSDQRRPAASNDPGQGDSQSDDGSGAFERHNPSRPAFDRPDADRGDQPSSGPSFGGGDSGGGVPYGQPPGGPGASGFAQRVPGASFAAGPPPADSAESRSAVPQPRDPAERPATGTARPVSASASVPVNSRVAPVDPAELPPPSPAAAKARVYGRAATPAGDTDDPDGRPVSGQPHGNAGQAGVFGQRSRPDADEPVSGPAAGRDPDAGQFAPRPGAAGAGQSGPGGSASGPYGSRPAAANPFGAGDEDAGQSGPGRAPSGAYGSRPGDATSGGGQSGAGPGQAGSDAGPFGARPGSGGPGSDQYGARNPDGGQFGSGPDAGGPDGGPFGSRPGAGGPDPGQYGSRPGDDADDNAPGQGRPDSGAYGRPVSGGPNAGRAGFGRPDADSGDLGRPDHPRATPQNTPSGVDPSGAWPWDAKRQQAAQQDRPGQQGQPGDQPHGSASVTPFQRGGDQQQPSAATPQSPARASGRATASARVAPPGQDAPRSGPPFSEPTTDVSGRSGPPFSEPTTDVSGRGQAPQSGRATPPDHYSEHTTDISGRGRPGSDQHPYVPAPALPSMHAAPPLVDGFPAPGQQPPPPGMEGDRPRMGGVFPGPPTRGTVAPPPGPEETASWPSRNETEADRSPLDQFKPDPESSGAVKAEPPTPHVRMLPVLLGVIIGAALLVGAAFGLVYLISGDSDSGFSVSAGECVKRDGTEAVKSACTEAGAFEVVSVTDTKEQCPDPGQPYVVNPTSDGRSQVLCLKPRT